MKTEDRIIQSAGELFYRNGIKSITMDDIASQLGISKKTIYQYYTDKDAIVMAMTDHELAFQHAQMDEIRRTASNAVDELLKMMVCVSGTFCKITPNLFYDMQKYHPSSWQRFHDFKEKSMQNFVEENLKAGISQLLYRQDINIKIMAKLRIEQIALVFNPVIFPPEKYSIKEVQLISLDHFIHGITTLKGHKLINKYKHIIEDE